MNNQQPPNSLSTKLLGQLGSLRGGAPYYVAQLGERPFKIGVRGLGTLSFPLNQIQIAALLARSAVAPFGKNRATVVDKTVRDTREIEARELVLNDAEWVAHLQVLLRETAEELAITEGIKAVPYKLLIYEPGGFFAEHQDSEKLPGMFGTLLIGLPSAHAGGSIVIDPGEGERLTVDFAENDAADFPAVAFLADRKHEILPVTEGYRVVLVYNLVHAGRAPERVDVEAAARELAATLQEIKINADPLILALDHQYTDTNFSTAHLKGNDRVRVAALRRAAQLAGVNIRVGLITQSVSADWVNGGEFGQGYSGYGYSSYKRSGEQEPEDFAEIELGDVLDESLAMGGWLPEDGPELGSLRIEESSVLAGPGYRQDEPIEWSTEGYQGNWGMTADYVYQYAGVVIWHPASTARLLEKLPLEGRLDWAYAYGRELEESPRDKQLLNKTEYLLQGVQQQLNGTYWTVTNVAAITRTLAVLSQHGSEEPTLLFGRWEPILLRLFTHVPAEEWGKLVDAFGAPAVDRLLSSVVDQPAKWPNSPEKQQLRALLTAAGELARSEVPARREVGMRHLTAMPDYLRATFPKGDVPYAIGDELIRVDEDFTLGEDWVRRIGDHLLLQIEKPTYLHDSLGKALREAKTEGSLYTYLHVATLAQLRESVRESPQPYPDLARPLPEGMNQPSGSYPEVMKFLVDPAASTFRYQAPQDQRTRLENYLRRHQLDVDFSTLRTRPSHTLLLTKNDRSHYRALREYENNQQLLVQLTTPTPPAGNLLEDFIHQLRQDALRRGVAEDHVLQALRLYRDYFLGRVVGRELTAQDMPEPVDALLDDWEDRLSERHDTGADDRYVPDPYPSYEHMAYAAFAGLGGGEEE